MSLTASDASALMDTVNQDAELQRRGKYYSVSFGLLIEPDVKDQPIQQRTNFFVENGQLIDVNHEPADVDFTIQSSAAGWDGFGEDDPSPGFHDISALLETKRARLEGNIMPWLSNMLFVKGVIEAWRRL